MAEPLTTLTATTIATLAFQKFLESSSGELAKKFTDMALTKMDQLRQIVWSKLRAKGKAEDAMRKIENQGNQDDLDSVIAYLQVAMDEDLQFAAEIKSIAHEIIVEHEQDNRNLVQINYGGTNYQTQTGKDNTNFFGGQHYHKQK